MGKQWKQWLTLFFWAAKSLQMVTAAMKLKDTYSLEGKPNLDSILKSRDITLPTKVCLVKAMVFPGVMYGCESWTIKKAEHGRIDAFELWHWRRFLRVPWTARIQPVHPKGDQSWVFIGRTDAEAETPIIWPLHAKSWLIWKDPDAGKDWGQEEKGMTEDEMVGWHYWHNGHGFAWTLEVGDGHGDLVCCGSWGHKELDMTEWLNWIEGRKVSYKTLHKLPPTSKGVKSRSQLSQFICCHKSPGKEVLDID